MPITGSGLRSIPSEGPHRKLGLIRIQPSVFCHLPPELIVIPLDML